MIRTQNFAADLFKRFGRVKNKLRQKRLPDTRGISKHPHHFRRRNRSQALLWQSGFGGGRLLINCAEPAGDCLLQVRCARIRFARLLKPRHVRSARPLLFLDKNRPNYFRSARNWRWNPPRRRGPRNGSLNWRSCGRWNRWDCRAWQTRHFHFRPLIRITPSIKQRFDNEPADRDQNRDDRFNAGKYHRSSECGKAPPGQDRLA